jgi:hypothetical protein
MWKFLSRLGKSDSPVYLLTAIVFCSATPRTAAADNLPAPTTINGEVIFGVNTYSGETSAVKPTSNRIIFNDRVRLNIKTTFTGRDRLKIQVQSSRNQPLNTSITGTNMTRSGYDGVRGDRTNLSLLQYTFPIDDGTKLTAEITGCGFSENFPNFNPSLASSGSGAVSRFGRYAPIYRLGNEGAGITIDRQVSPELNFTLGYSVPSLTAADPAAGGLFGGANAIIGQLSYHPQPNLNVGVAYAHSYHPNGTGVTGNTGSINANNPFGGEKTSAHHYSLAASYQLSPHVVISGWVGFTDAHRKTAGGGNANMSNYALTLALNDFGSTGNTLGLVIGVPPKLVDITTGKADPDTSLHLEVAYGIKVNENLSITPSILLISNPEHDRHNSTIYVGGLRTTFRF